MFTMNAMDGAQHQHHHLRHALQGLALQRPSDPLSLLSQPSGFVRNTLHGEWPSQLPPPSLPPPHGACTPLAVKPLAVTPYTASCMPSIHLPLMSPGATPSLGMGLCSLGGLGRCSSGGSLDHVAVPTDPLSLNYVHLNMCTVDLDEDAMDALMEGRLPFRNGGVGGSTGGGGMGMGMDAAARFCSSTSTIDAARFQLPPAHLVKLEGPGWGAAAGGASAVAGGLLPAAAAAAGTSEAAPYQTVPALAAPQLAAGTGMAQAQAAPAAAVQVQHGEAVAAVSDASGSLRSSQSAAAQLSNSQGAAAPACGDQRDDGTSRAAAAAAAGGAAGGVRPGGGINRGSSGGGGGGEGDEQARGDLTVAFLEENGYFDVTLSDAAHQLGVGVTTLKKLCRQNGLGRWPFRARCSLRRLRDKMREYFAGAPAEEQEAADAVMEREFTRLACMNVGAIDDAVKQFRQAMFKLEFKARQQLEAERGNASGRKRAAAVAPPVEGELNSIIHRDAAIRQQAMLHLRRLLSSISG